ncbi:hypothetical protein ABZ408_03170 [Streptomyces tibetensis]
MGTDTEVKAYIAVAVAAQEEHDMTHGRDALRTLIQHLKTGQADHLL